MRRYTISNFKDYLQFEYSIPQSVFKIEPSEEIQAFIATKGAQIRGPNKWLDFESSILGEDSDFENKIFTFWKSDCSPEKKIVRWFWLNKAKTTKFNRELLNKVTVELNDPDKLLDQIYLYGLESVNIDREELGQRREILTSFIDPLFFNDKATFEQQFSHMKKMLGENPEKIIERIVGLFDFERKTIIEIIPQLIRNQSGLSTELLSIIRQIWPELAEYIECATEPERFTQGSIVDNFEKFAESYRSHYILSKLAFDKPTDELERLHKEFSKQWMEILAGINVGKIPNHENKLTLEIRDKRIILLDAVGFEWSNVVKFLFESLGWQVSKIMPIFASLPSVTEFSTSIVT